MAQEQKGKDEKSPEQEAKEKAARQLQNRHRQEWDDLVRQNKDQVTADREKKRGK